MAQALNSEQSNEDWLVMRARLCFKTDPYAAKAWMLTARSLFPKNFNIQFEAYNLEKLAKNATEAAKLLEALYTSFPDEGRLWTEVHCILDALQADTGDRRNNFLTEVLAEIPTQVQCQMLLGVSDKIADKLEQCRLLLLAMRKFPNLINEHGLKLIDSLISAENMAQFLSPVNCYRKLLIQAILCSINLQAAVRYLEICVPHKHQQALELLSKMHYKFHISTLKANPPKSMFSKAPHMLVLSPINGQTVCDVLPLVLQKGSLSKVQSTSLYLWLQKSVEFYISFVTQPPSTHEPSTPLSPDLLSPTKKCRRASIPGLQDKECMVADPWGSLFSLLILIGQKLGWEMDQEFFTKSRDFQWQYILNLYNRAGQSSSDSHNQQILYTTTVLFLECLYHYICSVDTDVFHSGSSSTPLVIIEGFKAEQTGAESQPPTKRLKAESLLAQVHATESVPNSQRVIQNFLTAFKCYELLYSLPELQREFDILCTKWRMETWSWMVHFQTDMYFYQGAFQEAVRHLQNYSIGSKTKLQIRHSLQLACCFYCLNNYSKACELILDVITALPIPASGVDSTESANENQFIYGSGRHLVLVPCSEAEIMPYCIQMLLTCFKEKAFSPKASDTLLGHTMVLLQYDWPKHEGLFSQITKKMRKKASFSYNLFFNYIINVDILEEFAFMKTQEGGKVNLDILPVSTSIIAQQRTVTRGVNKGVSEDFIAMMEKQIKRCDELPEKIIRQFLNEERTNLLSDLL